MIVILFTFSLIYQLFHYYFTVNFPSVLGLSACSWSFISKFTIYPWSVTFLDQPDPINRLMVIMKYSHLNAIEGLILGQYSQNVVWRPMGGHRTLSGVHKVKSVFIMLCFSFPFLLSFSISRQWHFPETVCCVVSQ